MATPMNAEPSDRLPLSAVPWRAVFDSVDESGLHELAVLAASMCRAPIALITLVDATDQWFKVQIGLSLTGGWESTFCAHAIRESALFVVPDASGDARFSQHPHVHGEPHVRFYAGMPLIVRDGAPIGTLCVMDTVPRDLGSTEATGLRALATQIVLHLELRRRAIQLEQLNARLATEMAERGRTEAALVQREIDLRESQRALERVDALRRELVANVSHDLRTPLASLRAHLDTLLLEEVQLAADQRRQYLNIATRQAERLTRLVNELFELARLDADETPLQLVPFSLSDLVQDAILEHQIVAQRHGVQLRRDVPIDLPWVTADLGLIARVLDNLLDNAFRHTPQGGTVTVTLAAEPTDRVTIVVADTGGGIHADDLPFVFNRFRRARTDADAATQGAGLGLAIAQKIVALHGSRIDVESRANEGAAFRFALTAVSSKQSAVGGMDLANGGRE